jgi:hypothetical protein
VASNGPKRCTFISSRPFARIDHIFVSSHFTTESVSVIRNYLTRVSSDHLPLLADLHVESLALKDEVDRMISRLSDLELHAINPAGRTIQLLRHESRPCHAEA